MGREKLKEETEEDLEDTIGGEKTTSQTARLAGRREGGEKKTTGRWKLVDRESEKGEGQHGARKIGPAKISLISLSEIAAKCNASPVDERSPSAASSLLPFF